MSDQRARPRVLVVDDDAMVLRVLLDTLVDQFDVVGESNGRAALERVRVESFDVLLADQRMPGMSGVELAEQARELRPFLVAVLISAYTDPVDMIQAINRGQVYRFVRKPWNVDELILTLRQAHERCQLLQRNRSLLAELERRLGAVEILQQVMSAATVMAGGHPADVLLERLGEVIPHDLVGLLLASSGVGATVQLRGRSVLPEANLLDLHEQLRELYHCAGGAPLADEQIRVRVDAELDPAAAARAVPSQVHLPLRVDGRVVGLLLAQAFTADAFPADATRLLDLLLNGTAEAVERVRQGTARHWRRLEQVLTVLPDGVVIADAAGAILLANQAARRLLDVPVVTSERLWQAVGVRPDSLGGATEVTVKRQLELGSRAVVASVATLPATSAGEAALLVLLRDVSELEQEDLRRREFVSTLSHEIRTPLTSVTATLDLLQSGFVGQLTPKQRDYVCTADRACQSLNLMIDNLLDLERFGRGGVELDLRPIEPTSPVRDLAARYEAAARERVLTLVVEIDEPIPRLEVDPYRFEQVVTNLLGNAIKFATGGSTVTVLLSSPATPADFVVLGVHNQGEPIPPAALLGLFERFRQTARRQQAGLRGSGLGLAIVRSIVQAHRGAVFAESNERGTTLWLVLPVAQRRGATPELKDCPWVFVGGGDSPVVRATAAGVLARTGLRVALSPTDEAGREAMREAGGLCVTLGGATPMALPTIHCPTADGESLTRIGEAMARVVRARGVGLSLVPRPVDEVGAVLRALGVHEVAAGHGQQLLLDDPEDALGTLFTVAEALAPEARRLREVRAMLRRAAANRVGDTVAVIALSDQDGFRAVYGARRLAELVEALREELRRVAAVGSPGLVWTGSGWGAVVTGVRAELEGLFHAVRARVSASIRVSLRHEDRARGYLLIGELQLPLPSITLQLHPTSVDEAEVRAALGI